MNNDQLIGQVSTLQRKVDDIYIPEMSPRLLAPFLDLPGKVGIWYAGNVQRSTGNIYDSTGQGRTLTYNGNPTINYLSNGVAYADLDGVGDFWNRADETDLDILGTETWAANPGLTAIGWFWTDSLVAASTLAAKWGDASGGLGNNRSWLSRINTTGTVVVNISTDGAVSTPTVTSTNAIAISQWFFAAVRFKPSVSLDVFLQNVKTSNTTSIPASLFNNNVQFNIGAYNNGASSLLNGRFSIYALCANALNDATIQALFQQTRNLYGV